ncbi:MAG: hypothetical protein KKF33_11020, partial [Alphaproteobacteria bacterium]|nr:hypothetical protein [Alphaproteobacteria bacterium]
MQEKRRIFSGLAIAACAIVAIVLGARTINGEAQVYLAHASTPAGRIVDVAEGRGDIGLATQSQKAFLYDCGQTLVAMLSPDVLALTDEQRTQLAPTCLDIAQRAVAASPTNSFAYFVMASAAAATGDYQRYNQSMQLSYLTGRSEEWIAEWRMPLVERLQQQTQDSLTGFHQDDIRLMIKSFRGITTIAAYFVTGEDFRNRVTALLDPLPAEEQARFLS